MDKDVDPCSPIWASETVEIWGMCRHSRLACPSFLFGEEIKPVALIHIHVSRKHRKTFYCRMSCSWKFDDKIARRAFWWDLIRYCADCKPWFVLVFMWEWPRQDVGPFPEENRILPWCRRLEKREWRVWLWGIGIEGGWPFSFHLHADGCPNHYIEGRCSYWHVNEASCVLCRCDHVNWASVLAVVLYGS